jgi:outer membrane protein OmpA-like peptidoglycan-associated protein
VRNSPKLTVFSCTLLLCCNAAFAQGVSTDVEFIHPTFGAGAFTGVDVARNDEPMTVRAGLVAQYERLPVLIYNPDGYVIGAPVKNRAHVTLGTSVDLTETWAVHLAIPTAADWAGDPLDGVTGDGFGLGDMAVGARVSPVRVEAGQTAFSGGLATRLMLPIGRKEVFLGDRSVRVQIGLLASIALGPVEVATDLGALARQREETSRGFVAGSELLWGNALRVSLPKVTQSALYVQTLSRAGFANFLNQGGENAAEGIAGVQVDPNPEVRLDLGFGQGFTEGMGTTDYRVVGTVTLTRRPKTIEPVQAVVREPPPPLPPPPPVEILVDEPETGSEWEEGELARITANLDRIVIRDMLQFEVGNTTLLDASRPTLEAVAKILNDNASIGHLVIEGHASEDGDFNENYTLSLGRAEVIFREFLRAGLHPDRVSFRAMGEVEPLHLVNDTLTQDENDPLLARNRRVEFHIVYNYLDVMDIPERRNRGHREPWSGQPYKVIAPKMPVVKVSDDEKDKPIFEDEDEDIDFEDEDEDIEFDVRDE